MLVGFGDAGANALYTLATRGGLSASSRSWVPSTRW